jgi:hypothetical protein
MDLLLTLGRCMNGLIQRSLRRPRVSTSLTLLKTASRTTLDTILARLDALTTKMEQDYSGDSEQDDGYRRGRARRVVRHSPNDLFAKIKFKKFHLLMVNMIMLHILIGNWR